MVHDDLVGLRKEIVRNIGHGNGREHRDLSDRKRHGQPEVIQGQPDGGSSLEGRHVRPALTLRQHYGGGQDKAGRELPTIKIRQNRSVFLVVSSAA